MKRLIQTTAGVCLFIATVINMTGSDGMTQIYAYLIALVLLPIGWRMENGSWN